jgi:hypothetical protein
MNALSKKDKGGRRFPSQRRSRLPIKPVLEKRTLHERRSGQDRRTNPDPVIRITGDERRRAFRELGRG